MLLIGLNSGPIPFRTSLEEVGREELVLERRAWAASQSEVPPPHRDLKDELSSLDHGEEGLPRHASVKHPGVFRVCVQKGKEGGGPPLVIGCRPQGAAKGGF